MSDFLVSQVFKTLVFKPDSHTFRFPSFFDLRGISIFFSMGVSQSTARADGCPVDHENMSPEQIAAFLSHRAPSRSDGQDSNTETSANSTNLVSEPPPVTQDSQHARKSDQASSGCPVDHENMTPEQIASLMSHGNKRTTDLSRSLGGSNQTFLSPSVSVNDSSDSVAKSGATSKTQMYDVYAQPIDPSNLMPSTPNQLPSPGQQKPLSTDRAASTIPKSGDDESTWIYPSPQMFYNALKRKGKSTDVEESDIPTVVAVHNKMNEATWSEIRQWETRYHCHQCQNPKLKRFRGRPHELSPAARFRMWFRGYPRPFDRHDWIVDRCGLADARYIIDYYYTDNGPDPIEIHVRPAIDSISAAYDRMRFGLLSIRHSIGLSIPPLPQMDTALISTKSSQHDSQLLSTVEGESIDDAEFTFLTELTPAKIKQIGDDVRKHCSPIHNAFVSSVAEATGEHDVNAHRAHMSLNYCMAQHICKGQASEFLKALESGKDPADAYSNMTACLDRFQIMARRTIMDAAGIAQSGPEFPAGVIPSTTQRPNETSVHPQAS